MNAFLSSVMKYHNGPTGSNLVCGDSCCYDGTVHCMCMYFYFQMRGDVDYQPYTKPSCFTARIILLILTMCLTLCLASLSVMVIPGESNIMLLLHYLEGRNMNLIIRIFFSEIA